MGTKVEEKRYIPGCFTVGHFNLITRNNNWPPYYEDKLVNSHNFYNEFAPIPTNVYSCYDKEMLKQTILEHEAIFRKQVHELHRLYRKQKDLMENFERRDLEKSKGLMWKMHHQSNSTEFVNGAPIRDGSVGLDLNEPGTDCSDMERSSVNFSGFQGIMEEGTSMNNYCNAPGGIRNGWSFIKGEINGKYTNGVDFYPSTNFKQKNGSLSQHESKTATIPWLRQEQTHHASIPVPNVLHAPPCTGSMNENRGVRDLDLNLNESLPEEEEEEPQTLSNDKIERNYIDLNDSPPPSEVSPPRPTGVQIGDAKRDFVIDLEAPPAVCEEEEEEEVDLHDSDSHVTAAAEAILAMSASAISSYRENTDDTLAWFANITTSSKELDVSSDESSVESFEALVLRLEETKLEEEGYHTCGNSKLREVAVAPPTVRARRGRRRQKKDFQKDILPGIVHLKKREVTEDLQIFGKVGPTKRVGRKPKLPAGPSCQTGAAEVAASEGLVSVLGWGQITRRCRKQRLPPGKVSVNSNY